MTLQFIRHEPEVVNDEFDNLENVVCDVVAEGFMGHDTIVGYIYIDAEGRPRKHWSGWL